MKNLFVLFALFVFFGCSEDPASPDPLLTDYYGCMIIGNHGDLPDTLKLVMQGKGVIGNDSRLHFINGYRSDGEFHGQNQYGVIHISYTINSQNIDGVLRLSVADVIVFEDMKVTFQEVAGWHYLM